MSRLAHLYDFCCGSDSVDVILVGLTSKSFSWCNLKECNTDPLSDQRLEP